MTLKGKTVKREWFRIPPWVLVGSVVILAPILIFWTHENLNREKKYITELLVEKGAALIRSFEAGTRTGMMGMMGMHGGEFRLQRLLTETASQPDIVYLIVTNIHGTVLAANDPEIIGSVQRTGLNLEKIAHSRNVAWREVKNPDGTNIFEVYGSFQPIRRGFRGHNRHGWPNPSGRPYLQKNGSGNDAPDVIFVGLNMNSVAAARKADTLHSILMALILFLIGFVGIFFLFLTQAYRTARETLTRVKAFSDSVVENMPIGLLFIDGDGTIASFNQTAERTMKLPAARALGKNAEEILPPQLWSLVALCESRKQIIEVEMDCPLEDGSVVPMDVIVSLLNEDDGAPLGYIVLFRDLTEIQDLKGEVERSRRLASLGKLAAGIAHEIRNPLSSIKGFATYFKERYRDVAADQETADIMIQEVERLNRVIGQLLEFARPVSIAKMPTDVPDLLRQSVKLVEADAVRKKIRVELKPPLSQKQVSLDPDRIKQVLLNVYLNALEAMGEGGILSISLPEKRPGFLEIVISDTGRGIAKEDLAHVFDPYFTRRPAGTGLGLAIVHKIMESHGGEVRMESTVGKGTTVTLSFPATGVEQ